MRGRDVGYAGGYTRRRLLAMGATAAVAGLAGCGSVDTYEFSARPVILPAGIREALGYETLTREQIVETRSRTIGGVEVTATVENHVRVYGSPDDSERGTAAAPIVGITSTPSATVMGRSFNPIAQRSLASLLTSQEGLAFLQQAGLDRIKRAQAPVRWKRGPTFLERREGVCLDAQTTLESYAGLLGGEQPNVVFVHLTRVKAESVVLATAIHGHDIEEAGREFVGSEGYLTPAAFEETVETFAQACASLRYASEG